MEISEKTYLEYVEIREQKLVLVKQRIEDEYYSKPKIIDLITGTLLDVIA